MFKHDFLRFPLLYPDNKTKKKMKLFKTNNNFQSNQVDFCWSITLKFNFIKIYFAWDCSLYISNEPRKLRRRWLQRNNQKIHWLSPGGAVCHVSPAQLNFIYLFQKNGSTSQWPAGLQLHSWARKALLLSYVSLCY